MNIIGIESSCDETSVSILRDGEVLANIIASQDFHKNYGGVVPELSSRAHLQMIIPLIKQALDKAEIKKEEIDLVTATAGPGLIGAVLVGFTFAKGLALSLRKPFVPVNHIEGHIFSGFLMKQKPEFPYLSVVISGGHTLLLIVKNDLEIIKLGSTIDDAAGEAFDKVAKMIGLGYPGGPKIQKYADQGNSQAIKFPVAQLKNKFNFSFSGLKTAVLRYLQNEYGTNFTVPESDLSDICASFEDAVIRALTKNIEKTVKEYKIKSISVVGGVAANKHIKSAVEQIGKKYNKSVIIPDLEYCGDNAAMIAYRGWRLFENGKRFDLSSNAFPALKPDTFIEPKE